MTARIKFSLAIASCAAVVPAHATVIPAPTGLPRLSETPVRGPAPCGKSFRHSKSDHFPATTQLAQSDHRTKISYENILSSYDRGPIASYESAGAESTNTPPPSRRTSHPDTNRPHLPSLLRPNSEHQSLSGSKLIIGPLGTPKQPTVTKGSVGHVPIPAAGALGRWGQSASRWRQRPLALEGQCLRALGSTAGSSEFPD